MVFMMFGSMLLSNPVLPLVDADLIPPGKAYFVLISKKVFFEITSSGECLSPNI